MAMGQWLRVLDAVGGLVELSGRFRRRAGPGDAGAPGLTGASAAPGGLETRLAGVLVAALKEAFDRDSARLELERSQIEAERRRVEQALRADLHRQAAERVLAQLRLIAVTAVAAWALSAALAVWLPGMRGVAPRTLLGAGWAAAFAALGCALAGSRRIVAWPVDAVADRSDPATAALAPWFLLAALASIAASLLLGL